MAIRAALQKAFRQAPILLGLCLPLIASASPTELGRWETSLDTWYRTKKGEWKIAQARDAVFSPDGKTAAVARLGGTVDLIRLHDQKQLTVFDISLARDDDYSRPVCLAFSPDGSRLAIGFWSGKTILIADLAAGKILRRIKTVYFPRRIRFSPAGRFLLIAASGLDSGWNTVYSLQARKTVFNVAEQTPLTITRDDRYLFHSQAAGRRWLIRMREATSGRPLKTITPLQLGLPYAPFVLRSLRDHRILIGTRGIFHFTDRFFTEVLTRTPTMGHDNRLVLPMADGRYLVSSDGSHSRLFRLHDGRWKTLPLPAGGVPLSAYPRGNAFFYFNPKDNSIAIFQYTIGDSGWNQ